MKVKSTREKFNQATTVLFAFYGYATSNMEKGIGVRRSSIEFCQNTFFNDEGKLTPENIRRGYYFLIETFRGGRAKRGNKAEPCTASNVSSVTEKV